MKKVLTLMVVALCSICLLNPVSASEPDSKGANVTYQVTESYDWNIHADIDFGQDAGVNQTISKTQDSLGNAAAVAVTQNRIADGKKIEIRIASVNGFKVVNGNTSLDYTVKKSGDVAALAANAVVLAVNAGTNTGSQALEFALNTGSATAEVAGTYLDALTYSAAIVNQ